MGKQLLIGGDLMLFEMLSYISWVDTGNKKRMVSWLNTFTKDQGLVDIWRKRNKTRQQFTCSS